MSNGEESVIEELPLEGAGQRLRRAREEKKLSLEQVAGETRIPQRHLETIETGDFSRLPARTYAIGFARTYARVVDLDEKEIAGQVRAELNKRVEGDQPPRSSRFEPGDPARVPSRRLAWFSAFAALLLVAGGLSYFKDYFFPGAGPGSLIGPEETADTDAAGADASTRQAVVPAGPVTFTAIEPGTWVKFYDANGDQLMQKEMAQGESYTVPADAEGPQIWTGRPYALEITVGGRPVPKLSEEDEILKDVPVTPEALLARGQDAVQAGEGAGDSGEAGEERTTT